MNKKEKIGEARKNAELQKAKKKDTRNAKSATAVVKSGKKGKSIIGQTKTKK